MEWSIYYLEQDGIVFVKTSGNMNWDANRRLSVEMLSVGRKYGENKFLFDHRDVVLELSILEIDDLPRMFKEIGMNPKDKAAILYEPTSSHSSEFIFFQNVSLLSSLQFRLFCDKEKAIAWLASAKPFGEAGLKCGSSGRDKNGKKQSRLFAEP